MTLEDPRGLALTGTVAAAVDQYEAALDAVLSFHGDPIGAADAALALDPTLVSAHLLKAHTFAFSLHPGLLPKAVACLDAAAALGGTERERAHQAAARTWLAGDLDLSRGHFDRILRDHPRDLLALMFAHQADFFAAAEAALLERPTAALAAWSNDLPGHGYVLAMRAFGLEEAGRYAEAEALALTALDRNPRDAWAIHAVAHVLEMQGRDEAGIAWYAERRAAWAEDCFFAVHNWWHWALYHVDRGETAAALALYDQGLTPDRRSITLNLCDAAALLWRLELAGEATGDRFAALADAFDAPARQSVHVFNDVHAMLAFVGAGRLARAAEHLAELEARAMGANRHALMLRQLGVPAARAVLDFAHGRWAAATAGFGQAMTALPELTGSRAQRDVVVMSLIEASIRAGEQAAARALLERRLAAKPRSERIRRDLARCR
jgi:tetratricopeptide (TPR) repeat protein